VVQDWFHVAGCRRVHLEGLRMLWASPSIMVHQIRVDEMDGSSSARGAEKKCIKYLVGKPEGKRPLGRPRRR